MSYFYGQFRDLSRIVFWGEGPVEGKQARLVFSTRDGQPRVTVYTGVQGKTGVISFPTDIPTFTAVLTRLKEIAEGPLDREVIEKVTSKTNTYENDKRTNQKRVVSTLNYGRLKNGVMFLCLTAEEMPKIVFEIKPSEWHDFLNSDGTEIDVRQLSKIYTVSIANLLLGAVSTLVMTYTQEEAKETGRSTPIKSMMGDKKDAPSTTPSKEMFDDDIGF